MSLSWYYHEFISLMRYAAKPPPEIYYFLAFMSFITGLFIGSFLNVCIYRIPAGVSIDRPRRSFCYRCGTMVKWYDNLPVWSYLRLRGHCRHCGAEFSGRYAAVEFLTGCLFLLAFVAANPEPDRMLQLATFWYFAFVSLLVVATFTDIDHWVIPDSISLGGAAVAVGAAVLIGLVDREPLLALFGPFPAVRELEGAGLIDRIVGTVRGVDYTLHEFTVRWYDAPLNAIAGALFGAGLLWSVGFFGKLFFRKDAMGFGDVKLYLMIGATLGMTGALVSFMIACVLGAIGGVSLIIAGKIFGKGKGAPFEPEPPPLDENADPAIMQLIAEHRGRALPRQIHQLPFGPWIALAAVIVLFFQHPIRETIARWLF